MRVWGHGHEWNWSHECHIATTSKTGVASPYSNTAPFTWPHGVTSEKECVCVCVCVCVEGCHDYSREEHQVGKVMLERGAFRQSSATNVVEESAV